MKSKVIDPQRFKFLIQWVISQGYYRTQEELGKAFGVNNKSTLSQIISGKQTSLRFVECVLGIDERINKDWIYGEAENMLIEKKNDEQQCDCIEDRIKKLETDILLLQKDVKYYADMADSRLQTINVQNKLIDNYEKQLIK
jgi:hypothetical protein